MADMNHIYDPAFDENTEHGIKGGIPALEKAQAQDDQTVQHEQHSPHRNIAFAGNDRAQNIKSSGRAPCTKRKSNPAGNNDSAENAGQDRVLGQLDDRNDGQEPGGGDDRQHA
ncbi:hypothetical protein D3C80_1869400 [compost metagenome]